MLIWTKQTELVTTDTNEVKENAKCTSISQNGSKESDYKVESNLLLETTWNFHTQISILTRLELLMQSPLVWKVSIPSQKFNFQQVELLKIIFQSSSCPSTVSSSWSIADRLYSSLTIATRGKEIPVDPMMAYGIHCGYLAENQIFFSPFLISNSNNFYKISKKLTDIRDVEQKEEYHATNIVDTSQKSSHNSLRNRINNLNAKFKENWTGWVS